MNLGWGAVDKYKIFGSLEKGLSLQFRIGKVDDELGLGIHATFGYYKKQKAGFVVCEIYVGSYDLGASLVYQR